MLIVVLAEVFGFLFACMLVIVFALLVYAILRHRCVRQQTCVSNAQIPPPDSPPPYEEVVNVRIVPSTQVKEEMGASDQPPTYDQLIGSFSYEVV